MEAPARARCQWPRARARRYPDWPTRPAAGGASPRCGTHSDATARASAGRTPKLACIFAAEAAVRILNQRYRSAAKRGAGGTEARRLRAAARSRHPYGQTGVETAGDLVPLHGGGVQAHAERLRPQALDRALNHPCILGPILKPGVLRLHVQPPERNGDTLGAGERNRMECRVVAVVEAETAAITQVALA